MIPLLYRTEPQIVEKGWGHEKIIVNNDEYCGKILFFKQGASFSSHFHSSKRETFFCLRGRIIISGVNPETATPYYIELKTGETVEVPRLALHQVRALEESEIVEFSTPHRDDDSYRVAKGDSQLQ